MKKIIGIHYVGLGHLGCVMMYVGEKGVQSDRVIGGSTG